MKLAVLADIHANLPALQTVTEHLEAWRPDRVIVAGDVVNRGPRPAECLRFVQDRQRDAGWLVVLGNHEEYVISQARPDAPRSGPQFEIHRGSYWTYQKLDEDVSALEAMPFQISLPAPDGGQVRVTHASMLGTREGIYRRTPDEELIRKIGRPAPGAFCVGHTHRPLVRRLNGTLVINVGAVGLPFDGDARASYAQLVWHGQGWEAQIVRLDYDRAQAGRDFYETGFLDEAAAFAQLVQVELRTARSLVFEWTRRYEASILAGSITVQESVNEFLVGYRPACPL
jgi:predicted phosphodiesterase